MNATLLFAAMLIAQPPPVPSNGPPDVPSNGPPAVPMVAPTLTYADAQAQAMREHKPLVVFVGVPARSIDGATVVSVHSLSDGTTSAIVVSADGAAGYWLPITASDATILQRMAVTPAAVPFDPFSPASQRSTVQAGADGRVGKAAGPQFNASHNCPQCGARQVVISGRGPGGTHTHTCSRCATTWYH